jgi:hypothetical protein
LVECGSGTSDAAARQLRIKRGSLLPLDVKKSDPSFTVKSLGVDKQLAHNKHLRDCGDFECVLLYPDFDLVNTIPGTSQPFTVEGYKEAIGRPYNRVNLYLCKLCDFECKDCLLKLNYSIFLIKLTVSKVIKCFKLVANDIDESENIDDEEETMGESGILGK